MQKWATNEMYGVLGHLCTDIVPLEQQGAKSIFAMLLWHIVDQT